MMKCTFEISEGGKVSEMAIVDTFTKLIFGQESQYSDRELQIIQALRMIDHNVSLDDHHDMGIYLRALGVREMIGLVSRVYGTMVRGPHLEGRRSVSVTTGLTHGLRGTH
jgi:hypothetical protein